MSSSLSLSAKHAITLIGRLRQLACACAILAVSAGSASAINLTWQLNNVTFNDGGIATGSFAFDSVTNEVSNWSITVSPWTYHGTDAWAGPGNPGDTGFVTSPSFTYGSTIGGHEAFFQNQFYEGVYDRFILFRDTNKVYPSEYDNNPKYPDFKNYNYRELRLAFADALDTSGEHPLNLQSSFGSECWNCAPGRMITGGSVVAVPEPETYAMLMAGLGLMGFVARRRKQAGA